MVPKGSTLKSVADLRGKRVALNKGSNVHYLLVKQLEAAGVAYSEIQPVYLPPADARAAFERGAVDAWVIWDPFPRRRREAAWRARADRRRSADGKNVVSNHQPLPGPPAPTRRPGSDVVTTILDELAQLGQWAEKHPKDASTVLVKETGLDATVLDLAVSRFSHGAKPVTPAVLAEQQRIADAFHTLSWIPKPIQVADAAWAPPAGKTPTQQAQR